MLIDYAYGCSSQGDGEGQGNLVCKPGVLQSLGSQRVGQLVMENHSSQRSSDDLYSFLFIYVIF